jgi:hypothetical protein
VQYASAEARADEWIEPRRLKQSRRVAEMAEVTARWLTACTEVTARRLNACTVSEACIDAPLAALATGAVTAAVKTAVKTKKRVTVNPLPEGEEAEDGTILIRVVPEWRSGKRPSPPSASSTNQVDGVRR